MYSYSDRGNGVWTLVSATWPLSNWVPINMMNHRCRRRCLDCDVTMAFSSRFLLPILVLKDILYFKGTSMIHLNFKVSILYGLSFLAIVAAVNVVDVFLVCNHLVFKPICYNMYAIS